MPPRSRAPSPDRCRALCPVGVVRVAELQRWGLSRSLIARRCGPGGPWQSPAPGIVILHNGPVSRDDRCAAALLQAGDDAVITGLDALCILGVRRCPQPWGPVHVLVPSGRQRTSHGLVLIERTGRLPAPGPGRRHPVAPITRAAIDFTRRSTDRSVVRAVLAEVVQRGRATVPRLHDTTGRFVAKPDAWLDDVGLAWEIDSYEWHLSPADYDATLDRHSAMSAEGITVVHTQPRRIRTAPASVLDELERTYRQCARRPRPAILTRPGPT